MTKKRFKINSDLTDAMNETVNAAKNNAGDLHIEVIPLNKIELDPENPRELSLTVNDVLSGISSNDTLKKQKQLDKESLLSLSKSIQEQGILNPVVTYKDGLSYRLIAGERRMLASLLAKKPDIPARVLSQKPDLLQLSLIQWVENIERKDLGLGEKIRNLEKIIFTFCQSCNKQSSDIKVEELSHLLGCSNQLASNYKVVINASSNLLTVIYDKKINNLKKAALIARSPSKLQDLMISECINGATEKKLKSIVSEHSKADRPRVALERRGKSTTKFNLGSTTNHKVAKLILESLLLNPYLDKFKDEIETDLLKDPRYLNKVFNNLIKSLEEA